MKTFNKLFTICAAVFLFMLAAPHKSMAQDNGYVSDQEFYDSLQDYGTWVQDDQYGNVWVPDVDGDFRPYATNGYWVQTDYGTTWVSDYPWGWATFHYGRWRYDDYYGWEWIPGHEWAPAWVTWRQGGGYYGWAPMQPGITVSVSLGNGYYVPDNYWVCAPQAYINNRDIYRYYAPGPRAVTIIRNTTYVHNTYIYNNRTYITGPRARDVEQVTHQRVTIYRINNADRPGAARFGGTSINIYRPSIKITVGAGPVRVVDARAYRQAHPNDGIGRAGVNINVHINAAKLSAVAHSTKPDKHFVKVNPTPAKPVLDKGNPGAQPSHGDMPGDHKNVGTVTTPSQQAPANENKNPHKVAPAVMPPADHHDPTVKQPANNQAADQQKQQAQQAEQQQKQQQQKAPEQQAKQQAQEQQKAQEQQTKQQQQQAAQQAKQQQQQAAQQAKQQAQAQQQQAAQQAKQQQQQAAQQAKQQAQEQQKAQQQQAKQQQQQAAQQARQQAQQQQKAQQQQAAQQAKQQQQQAQQQAKQQQQAAQKAAQEAAKKQQQDQQKQQTPPGN